MTWKKVTGYELEWRARIKGGRVTILFGEGESPFTSPVLPVQDFSVMADMLQHELPRVWYEDVQKIIKTCDKEPTSGTG
jgi:predicted mannosyl-3-phosphoglycerate phosphatase (HAD superfamily)